MSGAWRFEFPSAAWLVTVVYWRSAGWCLCCRFYSRNQPTRQVCVVLRARWVDLVQSLCVVCVARLRFDAQVWLLFCPLSSCCAFLVLRYPRVTLSSCCAGSSSFFWVVHVCLPAHASPFDLLHRLLLCPVIGLVVYVFLVPRVRGVELVCTLRRKATCMCCSRVLSSALGAYCLWPFPCWLLVAPLHWLILMPTTAVTALPRVRPVPFFSSQRVPIMIPASNPVA